VTSGITSSLLSHIVGSPSTSNQFAGDLNQLAKDLQSGDLSSAQEDYVTLSQDALNGTSSLSAPATTSSGITTNVLSNIASSPSNWEQFVGQLNQMGTDLGNNNFISSLQDMFDLSATAQNAASAASTGSSSAANSTYPAVTPAGSWADLQTDIRAVLQSMAAGNTAASGIAMAQLATDAGDSPGASYLKLLAGTATSGIASNSISLWQLLESINSNNAVTGLLNTLG
jgi:hypothetical protein